MPSPFSDFRFKRSYVSLSKMAAECPLAERRTVEIKMGRSKFPGKPSKIGNRKRVNLSSCALPDENESSKAAENIYLGLSMFNEAFGDNEMADPGPLFDMAMSLKLSLFKQIPYKDYYVQYTFPHGPFHGFSAEEVEDALARARLQQKESEIEYKKQGVNINLQDSFQNELSSITGCFSLNGNHDKNKTRLCFDGGGSNSKKEPVEQKKTIVETSDSMPSVNNNVTSNEHDLQKIWFDTQASKSSCNVNRDKTQCKTIRPHNSRQNTFKLSRNPSFVSLQSRAAKKLLQKAKMSNLSEINKGSASERKFILPTYSMHSLRVIKPNKRFLEDIDNKKERLLRNKLRNNTSHLGTRKSCLPREHKSSYIPYMKELRVEITDDIRKRDLSKEDSTRRGKTDSEKESDDKLKSNCSLDSPKAKVYYTSTGKLILREPKLQLNRIDLGLTEGPFSSSSRSSSLSPNSQLNSNPVKILSVNNPKSCGVCGYDKFHRFLGLAKQFGIYCCEPCEKFITKIVRQSVKNKKNFKLQCLKGKGLCLIPSMIQHQNPGISGVGCEACWLRLCLKKFKFSNRLKTKLVEMLPVDMQSNINLAVPPALSMDDSGTFGLNNDSVKDFKWLNKRGTRSDSERLSNSRVEKNEMESLHPSSSSSVKELRRNKEIGGGVFQNKRKLFRHKGRLKTFSESWNRQKITLKGPRVKNVCRSASVVLGQPIATFPQESSPKKQLYDFVNESVRNCDKSNATNECDIESQGDLLVDKSSGVSVAEKKSSNSDKKSSLGNKQGTDNGKPSPTQGGSLGRTKKKSNLKAENPISIDFWETYDPEEIGETGFGLIGSDNFSVRALCFLCGSSGREKLIHCASCCEPYHEFCVNEENAKLQDDVWKYDWICPRCTVCVTCGKTSGQQLKCVKCDNSYHTECVDRVGGRLLHSPDRPWVCSVCLRCKSCNGVDVSVFVGNLPLCKTCFALRQKGNYCPLCQRCYEDDDYDCKMMECGQCKCWVHAKCEGLSDEKYQVLSFLPESVEYICRMCCVMPPAPWWIAVEAELKSGYLGVLKALSKNRKACTMLKWSPRKQCTCRQVNFTPRALEFEETKSVKATNEQNHARGESAKKVEQESPDEKSKGESFKPAPVLERKTSVEVINHTTEGSLKLTLKIMKGPESGEKSETEDHPQWDGKIKDIYEKFNIRDCSARVKKYPPMSGDDFQAISEDSPDDSQDRNVDFSSSNSELPEKRSLSSPLNPSSDSGIGSTDDELKTNSLTDEESCRLEDNSNRFVDSKISEPSASFFEEKNECICFLEVDTYNSRSKPFSPSLLSIKKKVTTSEYSSLQQFHMDMQRMIATTQSTELMEMYYQTVKEIFPWFDPKCSKVYSNSQKISNATSPESTPVKNSPTKNIPLEECKVPKEKLIGQPLEYYYSGYTSVDNRSCLMCKAVGDGAPNETGRLLYCGQNEWVHCNCALWSAEVFEEIDGSFQNVHSAINRGRSIRCAVCNVKGASIGCCARNCPETFHFSCARKAGCAFMDDKTMYCTSHLHETKGKVFQDEKEYEIRRPVYVELDKRKMKSVDSSHVRFAVGGLHIDNLGRFVMKLSDHPEAIIPDQFQCTRLFWSCYEPWKIVRYHFSVRVQEDENEGVDFGINLTIDHSQAPEIVDRKLKQLKYFQEHHKFLELEEPVVENKEKGKRKPAENKSENDAKSKSDDVKYIPAKRSKKESKTGKKVVDLFDPREEESCLSDSQNTADLIPPELEEAIFKDLPNDILDGISMQDIFMDIKTDLYENGEKEVRDGDDSIEVEEIGPPEQTKAKKSYGESQNEAWPGGDESKQNIYEWTDETCPKSNRDLKRSRSDIFPTRRNITLKSNQRSCSLNWNCKMDIHTAKWKRTSKCHTTGNLLDSQERGNMLQELKFTDGLVMVSTDSLTSVKDLKDRLAIQQEEGKENKCLPWHLRLQPRLLQVDGGVDSSSSGSEAGESPQRLAEENVISARAIPPPQPSPFSSDPTYSDVNNQYPSSSQTDYSYLASSFNLPQIDGMDDSSSDDSDLEYFKPFKLRTTQYNLNNFSFKIAQLDGSVDSESETKIKHDNKSGLSICTSVKDEPVKCNQCRCTYRTKSSYERHLETCSNDYMLLLSDGEGSEEESPFPSPKIEESNSGVPAASVNGEAVASPEEEKCVEMENDNIQKPQVKQIVSEEQTPQKKEKRKRPQIRKKPSPKVTKPQVMTNSHNVQQILVQQNGVTPTVLVQDIPQPNIIPGAFIDTGTSIQYVASIESQTAFTKPQLIASPSTLMSGGFPVQIPESPQLISSLPILPQPVQTSLPGLIIQQPQMAGTLISSQPAPLLMSTDQMMLGATPLVLQDPHTGAMYLASQNQPVYYNMETVVSNTVMQTNQFVSNAMSGSSFSQTSTQVVQTSKLEQVMNVPSNFILVGQNTTSDKIISSSDLICLPTSQSLIQNQAQIQNVVSPIIQASQAFNPGSKFIPRTVNPGFRSIRPMQVKSTNPPQVLNNLANNPRNQMFEVRPCVATATYSNNAKQKSGSFRSMPMMRPNVTKSPPTQYEKAVIVPKARKAEPKPVVECTDIKTPEKELIPSGNDLLVIKSEPAVSEKKEIEVVSEPLISPPSVKLSPSPVTPEKSDEPVLEKDLTPPVQEEVQPVVEPEPPSVSLPMEISESNPTDQEPSKIEVEEDVNIAVEEPVVPKPAEDIQEKTVEEKVVGEISSPVETVESSEKENEEGEGEEERPTKVDSPVPDVLPLQETTPPADNAPNIIPKATNPETETLKEKTSLFCSNQNFVATKLVTIHPRLIQSPENEAESENKKKFCFNNIGDDKGPKLIFDVISDDGFKSSSTSMAELWAKICDSVQEMRAVFKIPPLPISRKGHEILGMQNHGLQHCLEQLRGVEHCVKYKCKYFVKERSQKSDERSTPVRENLTGCARTETFCDRKDYDMFAWLASRHRRLPKLCETSEDFLSSVRRANSLPMAMRYRQLREGAKTYVGVYRSKIHGKGLFCLRDIEAGEMVIEYAGEVIRSNITDKREKYYTDKGIGCYMFRIDDHFVVDATMKGNAARFINHSCEPNCYSRVVDILGKKHIVIFALRRIRVMEELTYDYKFPFEDEKISCHCLSKKCRKYLN